MAASDARHGTARLIDERLGSLLLWGGCCSSQFDGALKVTHAWATLVDREFRLFIPELEPYRFCKFAHFQFSTSSQLQNLITEEFGSLPLYLVN
jgi:hypothetical protein